MSRSPQSTKPVVAVGVVCLRDHHVLLIRRANPPRAGDWSLPGGKIEFGEPAEDAVLRELREETGIGGTLIGLVDVVDAIFAHQHFVILDYLVRWTHGEPAAADDALEARFVAVSQLGEYKLDTQSVSIIQKALEMIIA